jgi:hypothetical protein
MYAFALERRAFGTAMPTPEDFRKMYEGRSEQYYKNYQQRYHQEMGK